MMVNNIHDSPLFAYDDLLVNMLVVKSEHPEDEETMKANLKKKKKRA
jgi:hypothetical protein